VNDRRQRRRAGKATAWRFHAHEYTTRLTGGTISTQVRRQGLAHIRRQRHPIVKQTFTSNDDFAGSPIDVIDLESNDLAGTEPETGK